MVKYLIRRLLLAIPTLFGGMTLIFLAINIIPGDPAAMMLGDYYTGDAYHALVTKLGLDQPLPVRYVHYLADVARGNLGDSFRSGRSVFGDIKSQFPYTLELAIASLILAILIGVTIGIISAVMRNRWPDQVAMLLALASISAPSFFVAAVLILIFSVHLGWLPALGGGNLHEPVTSLKYLVLPAIALGTRSAALIARLTRSTVIDVLGHDYVRTARAKGLRERNVLTRHAFRNALLPLITVIGLDLGNLLGGAAIIEIIFNRPGLGKLLVDGVLNRDYPTVQGTMIFFMVMILLSNLLADVGYAIADPRIHFD